MEVYVKILIWMEYIIPIALSLAILLIAILSILIHFEKEKRIDKFFLSHGYERKLLDVPSVGGGAFYGWVRESDHKVVDDRDLTGLSLKEIKEKYK